MESLSVLNINKTFFKKNGEKVTALDNISMKVEKGEIRGLLGPNGAGKTTLISLISGINSPDSGDIQIFGADVIKETEKTKKLLGVVPQEIVIEMAFTVEEVLYYYGGMFGLSLKKRKKRIDEVLEDLNLSEKKKERARSLSGGMKRRLMIAKAMMHQPQLLILDEPTAGVDVALRQKIWEVVRRLNREGTTILFTTHYLEEAEQLCDRITMINYGKIIKDGKLKDLLSEYAKKVILFELFNRDVQHLPQVISTGTLYEYPIENNDLSKGINEVMKHYNANIKSIRNEAASLEQIFLELTSSKK